MKKKFITLLLVMILVSSFSMSVLANITELNDEVVISPMFTYISMAEAEIFINSSGKATVETYLTGNSKVTSTKATIKLQQYRGGSWTTIKTWDESSNSRILNFSSTYYVSSGYEYRVQSIVTAYSGTQSESTTLTSSSQGY
ncbi:hypothetical protein KQI38_20815 [Tissierella carlieri]|uniref:hypothetical protein n=1 Tax=Tissierella carlieri TaxID=689904 RepID=UPI001C0F988D|nr:hypothetical protein [Tissierella carlieri]MBU5314471.1 hypothetical protein [Tissierella carlieri]